MNDIEHNKAKARNPQTNGIGEGFPETILQAFCQVAIRRKLDLFLAVLYTGEPSDQIATFTVRGIG